MLTGLTIGTVCPIVLNTLYLNTACLHLGLLRKGCRGGRDDGVLHQAYAHVAARPQLLRRRPERIALHPHMKLSKRLQTQIVLLPSTPPTTLEAEFQHYSTEEAEGCASVLGQLVILSGNQPGR